MFSLRHLRQKFVPLFTLSIASLSCGGGGGGSGSGSAPPQRQRVLLESTTPAASRSTTFLGAIAEFAVVAQNSDDSEAVEIDWFVDGALTESDAFSFAFDTLTTGVGAHEVEARLSTADETSRLSVLWQVNVLDAEENGGASAPLALNRPPQLESLGPLSDFTVTPGGEFAVTALAIDGDAGDELEYRWWIDGVEMDAAGPELVVESGSLGLGVHTIDVEVLERRSTALEQLLGRSDDSIGQVLSEAGASGESMTERSLSYSWFVHVLEDSDGIASPLLQRVRPLVNPRVRAGDELVLRAQGTLGDGGDVEYRWRLNGTAVGHSNSTEFAYRPSASDVGTHSVTISVVDHRRQNVTTIDEEAQEIEAGARTMSFSWIVDVVPSDPAASMELFAAEIDSQVAAASKTTAEDSLVVDNSQSDVVTSGEWRRSQGLGAYGPNSLFATTSGRLTFAATLVPQTPYDTFLRWSHFPGRSGSVPVIIDHVDGSTSFSVNQLRGAGIWNYVGTYWFAEDARVTLVAEGTGATSADAVCFLPSGGRGGEETTTGFAALTNPQSVILDNGGAGTSQTGSWRQSHGHDPYGGDAQYSRDAGTYVYRPGVTPGNYRVYLWWTSFTGRATTVPVTINSTEGARNVQINQRSGGGQWNLLGTFSLDEEGEVIINAQKKQTACADAARFEFVDEEPSDTTAPSAPSGLFASSHDGAVVLDWEDNAETDLAGYEVHRSTVSGDRFQVIATIDRSEYRDTNVKNESTYFYKVRALNDWGMASDFSDEIEATPADSPPVAPAAFTVTGERDAIVLDWSASLEADVVEYAVYRSESPDTGFLLIATVNDAGFRDTDVALGTRYYYFVTAIDRGGQESEPSATLSSELLDPTPEPPTGLTATPTTSGVTLDWHDAPTGDISSFGVYRSTSPSSGFRLIATTRTSDYFDADVEPSATYYYAVTAVGTNGRESQLSPSVSATVPAGTSGGAAPDAPGGLLAFSTSAMGQIAWTPNAEPDIDHYGIYRSLSSGSGFRLIDTTAETSYLDSNVTVGTTYFYAVSAVNLHGVESPLSKEVAIEIASPESDDPRSDDLLPPSQLTAIEATGRVVLDWMDHTSPVVTFFGIYRSTTAGTGYRLVGTSKESTFGDTNVTPETTYYYVVTAVDSSGNESRFSAEAAVSYAGTNPDRSIMLDWDPPSLSADGTPLTDLAGFRLFYGTQSGAYAEAIDIGMTSEYTVSGLPPGRYYFAVTAIDVVGNQSSFSTELVVDVE